jgi:hypothetical protein
MQKSLPNRRVKLINKIWRVKLTNKMKIKNNKLKRIKKKIAKKLISKKKKIRMKETRNKL